MITEHTSNLEKETVQLILRSVNSHRDTKRTKLLKKLRLLKQLIKPYKLEHLLSTNIYRPLKNTMLTLALVLLVQVKPF